MIFIRTKLFLVLNKYNQDLIQI